MQKTPAKQPHHTSSHHNLLLFFSESMTMKFSLALILFSVASSQAFTTPAPSARSPTQLSLMSVSESESIMKQANDCAAGECSLDDVDELIHVLQEQQNELHQRVTQIKELRESLQKVNNQEDRPIDEIRETVRAIFRVFQLGDKASGNDYPALSKPMGYPGEVGKGPTTAYDALPPKRSNKASP